MPPTTYYEKLKACAEKMRKHPTPAEAIFRDRLIAARVPFITQQVIGRYIVDFVLPGRMLIFELDGGVHGHQRRILYDKHRTEFLAAFGFKVKRIKNSNAAEYPLHKFRSDHKARNGRSRFDRAVHQASLAIKERSEAFAQRQLLKAMDKAAAKVKPSTAPRLIKRSAAL